jgi:hypothetical protein
VPGEDGRLIPPQRWMSVESMAKVGNSVGSEMSPHWPPLGLSAASARYRCCE